MPMFPNLLRFAQGLAIAAACASSSTVAHAADRLAYASGAAGVFGTLNLDTGSFGVLGYSPYLLAGLAVLDGKLYTSSYKGASQLYEVDTADGSLTAVGGTSGQSFYDFGSTPTALYGVGTDAKLYSISTADGHGTLIGSLGITLVSSVQSLSSNSSTLYLINGSSLYSLSTSTGAASLVGPVGSSLIGAMTMIDGTLYAGVSNGLSVATLDTLTGSVTAGPGVTGGTLGSFWGLAGVPVASVPEPGTWALWAAGGLLLLSRRRMHT